jgi:hypothetical protein
MTDLDEYLAEKLVDARLAELRADAAGMQWLAAPSVATPRPAKSFRTWLIDSARWFVNAPRPPVPPLRAAPGGPDASGPR